MNFQSISYGFGRVGSNPADDGAMRFFAFLINVSRRDLVLWLFLNIFGSLAVWWRLAWCGFLYAVLASQGQRPKRVTEHQVLVTFQRRSSTSYILLYS